MVSPPTAKVPPRRREAVNALTPRRRFTPAQRDPLHLPGDKIKLPPPPPTPPPPASINLIVSIVPPLLMLIGTGIAAYFSQQSSTGLIIMIPMFLMSLGFPLANILSVRSQKKAYQQALEQREQTYREQLAQVATRLNNLAFAQQATLQDAYPSLRSLKRIARNREKLLWARRSADDDFLSLRAGSMEGPVSFTVEPPPTFDPNDRLIALALELYDSCQRIPGLPALIPIGKVGSVAISGPATVLVHNLTRRLILDLVVHHSPQDVHLAVLGDSREAVQQWEWTKWLPHTNALGPEDRIRSLAFDTYQARKFLDFLAGEFHSRRERAGQFASSKKFFSPAYVVLIEDSDPIREHPDLPLLADSGYEAGIHLIFVGGRNWPRECRSRLETLDDQQFKYSETWSRSGLILTGRYESATLEDCDEVARTLAGLEAASSGSRVPLPESVRLSQVLGSDCFSVEAIKERWSASFEPRELLQFPIGVCARRDHLEQAILNLLPAEFGGSDAYHTILIGTTGSGKSEFMKSLVMGAATAYPPSLLNFFFMDFKGGAAFSIFETLPHVSGIVTNLSPHLVERGLDSIKNEIERRQAEFARARVQRIWDYNRQHADTPMPHLVLFLDEFARGLADFPRLREVLDVLVRQGRSLGMYLILANQDVNAEVDKLLNNVGWRIALKVARQEELAIIDRRLTNVTRAGQGYLRSLNGEITEFQAGYGGFLVQNEAAAVAEGFVIYRVETDGHYQPFYTYVATPTSSTESAVETRQREEEAILAALQQASVELNLSSAKRIYLEPLPEIIPLEDVLTESHLPRAYQNGQWQVRGEQPLVACWGKKDLPQACLQELLEIDFNDKDGHLWIVGAPGSGKDIALTSLLLSLALTHPPDRLHFYLLELGAGELLPLEALPHTGAVIRPLNQERERLVRLLKFLDEEMDRRIARRKDDATRLSQPDPFLFVVINNFAELRANFPDESERLQRFVRDGKAAGIHLIFVTSRGGELLRSFSNNIARRLVLQLGSRDEYLDIIGRSVRPLVETIPGRGYWVDGDWCECQIARPPQQLRDRMRGMREAWQGSWPRPIEILPPCIPLLPFLEDLRSSHPGDQVLLPVGCSYETLEIEAVDLVEASPCWLVLGPRESGKSNFLACAGYSLLHRAPEAWEVVAYAPRRSLPLHELAQREKRVRLFTRPDDILQHCQALNEALKAGQPAAEGRNLLLLVDDLGFAFQPGREALQNALNTLAQSLETASQMVILAAGLLEELRLALASPFLRWLRQGRTGLVFSKDPTELDWLGAQISLEYRRMDLPVGRGFFIQKGRPTLVQTPLFGNCIKQERDL